MLLIVVLVLIAKLALVSSECNHVPVKVKDFDWSKIADSRPWYWLLYNHDEVFDRLGCIVSTLSDPDGDSSAIITDAYDTRIHRRIAFTGNVTNLNRTGLFELHYTDPTWNGRFTIPAVDYDRYFIMNFCPYMLNRHVFGVAFHRPDPDKATLESAKANLEENGIDITQMPFRTRDYCQQAESSTDGGSSA